MFLENLLFFLSSWQDSGRRLLHIETLTLLPGFLSPSLRPLSTSPPFGGAPTPVVLLSQPVRRAALQRTVLRTTDPRIPLQALSPPLPSLTLFGKALG